MRPTFIFHSGEQRVIYRSKEEAHQSLEEALNASRSARAPVSAPNLMTQIRQLHETAVHEVRTVQASVVSRISRASAQSIAKLFSSDSNVIYSGSTKEVQEAMKRQALRALVIAQQKLDAEQGTTLAQSMRLTRELELSPAFQMQLADLATRVKESLEKEKAGVESRLLHARGFNRGALSNSLKSLSQRIKAVQIVGKDADATFKGTVAGELYHDIENATQYFVQTFRAYAPRRVASVPTMIQDYAENKPDDLQIAIEEAASQMFPDDDRKRREQIESMLRIAGTVAGDQSGWRFFKRRMLDVVAPTLGTGLVSGVAGGALVATGAGAVGLGVGVALRMAHNYYMTGRNSSSRAFRSQAASYFNQRELTRLADAQKIKDMPTLDKRMEALKAFKEGETIKIQDDVSASAPVDLIISRNDGSKIVATSKNDSALQYCLDLTGYGEKDKNQEYAVAIRKGNDREPTDAKKFPKLQINTASDDCFLTIAL